MHYLIKGKVIYGDGYGRKIGFPTINILPESEELPPKGVYAGVGIIDGREYRAGIVVAPDGKVDAHLIGYNGEAYGQVAVLQLDKFLREYKKFDTEAKLIAQIKKDIEKLAPY